MNHGQARAQLLGKRRVLGQQAIRVNAPAGFQVGQVGFERPGQFGLANWSVVEY
jgi:hypothetical protein